MAAKKGNRVGLAGQNSVQTIAGAAVSDKINFDDDSGLDALDDQPTIKEMDFESALEQFDDDDECKVYAHETVDGKIDGAYLFSEPVKGFKLDSMMDRIRSEYGSGNYRAVLKRNSKVIRGQSFSIKLSRMQQAAFDAAPLKQNNGSATAQPDNGMSVIMALMQQQSTRQHEMMMAMMGAKSNAQPDSTSSIIDAVSKIHNMTKRDDPVASKVDPLDMFLKGVAFAKDSGGSGEESVLQTAIKEVAPLLGELVRNQPPRAVSHDVPHGTKRETEALPPPQAAPSEFDALIKMLCRAAMQDADPVVYAELVMDQLTDEKALQLCQSEVGYGIFVAKLPADLYAAKKEWFDSLRATVIASVSNIDSGESGDSAESQNQE